MHRILLTVWALGGCAPVDASTETDESGLIFDSGAPPDTAAAEDTADTADTADTGEEPPTGGVIFQPDEGEAIDLTSAFTDGDYVFLDENGVLTFSPGTWWVRLTVVAASVSVVGTGAPEETILSAGEQGSVITLDGPFGAVSVEGVTLDRGKATGGADDDLRVGGGLRCNGQGSLSLTDVVVQNNSAGDGGGVYGGTSCTVDLERVTVSGNIAEDDGGGILLDYTEATFHEVTIIDNISADGGGLYLLGSVLVMTDSLLQDNNASVDDYGEGGGGMIVFGSGDVSISDTAFAGNHCANGGALLLSTGRTVLDGVTFTDNSGITGGAITAYSSATLEVTDSDFSGSDPEDVYLYISYNNSKSYNFGKGASFSCSGNSCTEND